MSETVYDVLDHLVSSFDFLLFSEIYKKNALGWNKVAISKNYDFRYPTTDSLNGFLKQQALHKMDLSNDGAINTLDEDLLYFYAAYIVPTSNSETISIVLAGATKNNKEYLLGIIEKLLPILSNVYHVHNASATIDKISNQYSEQKDKFKLYQSLLETIGDAVFYHDSKGRFIDCNQQAIISLGYSRSELLQKKVIDVDVGVNDGLPLAKILHEKVRPDEPVTIQSEHRRKDGSKFPVEVTISLHKTGNFLAVARDLSDRKKISKELADTQGFLQSVIDLSDGITYIYDFKENRIVKGASKIEDALGFPRGSIKLLSDLIDLTTEQHVLEVKAILEQAAVAKDDTCFEFESCMLRKDGSPIWVKTSLRVFKRDELSNPISLIATATNISRYKKLEEKLLKNQNKYKALVENSFDAIAIFDCNNHVTYASATTYRLLNYQMGDARDFTIEDFVHPDDRALVMKSWKKILKNPAAPLIIDEVRIRKKTEDWLWAKATLNNLLDDINVSGIVVNFTDISGRKNTELTLHKVSNFEPVTGLPNRNYLIAQLEQQILKAKETKGEFGLVITDINALNSINTAHGYAVGDAVILKIAETIKSSVSASDFIAKVGDDEFAIIFDNKSTYNISRETQDILESFNQLIEVDEHKIKVALSAGIATFPKDAKEPGNLISYAEIALKNAKQTLETFAFYKDQDSKHTRYRLELEKELLEAIENNHLQIVYQPIIDSRTGRIISLESLLRWKHAEKGAIPPNLFVKIAEETSLITRLSQWVLSNVIKQMAQWEKQELTPQVTINLSSTDIRRKDICEFITSILNQYEVDSKSLILEITESEELVELDFVTTQMQELNNTGLGIILDDFGTGFSSISHLLNLPIRAAKVDKSFVRKVSEDNEEAKNFLHGIINLIQGSGIKAVIEGVETAEQFQIISEMSDVYCQGYLFSKPLNVEKTTELLKQGFIDLKQFGVNQ